MAPELYDRVILKQGGQCPHLFHRLRLVAERDGCVYEACPDCLTRRITVEPGGTPDTAWLMTGDFTTEQASILPMEAA